ncbi:MAG: hypothetical protein SGI92_04605 [Bryobacteraceae bacterium]|nr:hypothetical protein [Bryobacteraceae bacterium]
MSAWPQQSGLANAALLAAFGQPVSYQQDASDPFTVTGILQRDTEEEQHQDGLYARLFVRLADFASRPDHGDEVVVNDLAYTVFEVSVDLTGAAWLRLRQHS